MPLGDYPTIKVNGHTIECYHRRGMIRVDGVVQMTMCYLGDMTKSEARKIRKTFRRAGWYNHAASPRLPRPPGWTRYSFIPVDVWTNGEES